MMKYEREGLLLPVISEQAPDSELFASLNESLRFGDATYKELNASSEQKILAPELWHNGQNADLTVNKYNLSENETRKQNLLDWKKDLIANNDIDPEYKQLYRWKVNENIANINIIKASVNGDMRDFKRWNEYIYGKPDGEIYQAAIDWVASDADKLLAVPDQYPSIKAAAEKVLKLVGNNRGNRELLCPNEDSFEKVHADHMRPMGYYGLLLAGVVIPEGKISNEIGDPILEHIVKNNLQSSYEIKNASGSTWGVSHRDQTIERPESYNLPAKRFVGLGAGHEIGSHLLEKENGSRGPILLASAGLDRYELGNEGRAVMREEIVYDKFDDFGKLPRWRDIIRRHIAISFANGTTNGEGTKSSSEVFELVNAIDTMYQVKLTPQDSETTITKANAKTDALLLRVLKGTDGTGGAYLKDKVYLEGHVACWATVNEQGASVVSSGDLGKFDINNPRHIASLQKFGLLPNNR